MTPEQQLEITKELAYRKLEEDHKEQRDSLYSFLQYYRETEKKQKLDKNRHLELICEKLEKVFNGEIKRLIINVPPRSLKCLHIDTPINTPQGNILLKDLNVGDNIYAYKDGSLVVEKVIACEPAKKQSYFVKTRTGRELIMSQDHRMLTMDGYKKMQDTKVGDYLYLVNKEVDSDDEINRDEMIFISHMIFEGDCRSLRYTNDDKEVVDEFITTCKNLGIGVKQYEYNKRFEYNIMGGKGGVANELLKKYGIAGHLCYTKRLPNSFFTMSLKQKWKFISIMFTTDGFFNKSSGGIGLANDGLIDDIQYLLSTCGVISSKKRYKNKCAGFSSLKIGRSQLEKIYENCDLKQKKEKCKKVLGKLGYSMLGAYPNKILKGLNGYYARKNGQRIDNKKNVTIERFERLVMLFPELEKRRYKDFICDEIVLIEDFGEQELRHIEVSGDKNFIANGLVSHNTEIVSIAFPAWCIGKRHGMKFMDISYSATLAEQNSGQCRNMYQSKTYGAVFPRSPRLKDDLNTKKHWENLDGGQYYASGSTGAITGLGADCIIIDDPLKPDDAMSDVVRVGVNNNFHQTLKSRLNSKQDGAIVIIMQRLHDDDLCGHLMDLETKGGEKRDKLIIKAIAEEDDNHRKQGESFFEKRFPLNILKQMKNDDSQGFSSQMQQEPTNKEVQEFHEERYKYHGTESSPTPSGLRIFTAVDPAFKTGQENDKSAIITGGFKGSELYILEITAGRFTPDILQDKIIYHIGKRQPEKVGIEAFQAQSMIHTFLKQELQRRGMFVSLEEITQSGDKLSKIRKLIPLYRNGLIYHKYGMDELELEEKRFPRGKHDDIVDCLQMLYNLYELQPNSTPYNNINFNISWDQYGRPVYQ